MTLAYCPRCAEDTLTSTLGAIGPVCDQCARPRPKGARFQ